MGDARSPSSFRLIALTEKVSLPCSFAAMTEEN